MTEHALLSPSAAGRWFECPGSLWATKDIPDTETAYAAEGTTAHALAEYCLKNNKPASSLLGMKTAVNDINVDDEMVEAIQGYVETIKGIMDTKHDIVAFEVEQKLDFTELLNLEAIKLALGEDTPIRRAFGTADVIILGDGELQVHDLKYGKGVRVSAVKNKQLLIYALAAYRYYSLCCEISKISVHIHQPRLNNYSEYNLTPNELFEFGQLLEKKAFHAYTVYYNGPTNDMDFSAGDSQCRFCKAAGTCNALASQVAEDIGAEFDVIDDNTVTQVSLSDGLEISKKLSVLDKIEAWVTAVRTTAHSMLSQGQQVPGYKLVMGRQGSRAWRDPEEAEKLLKSFRLKQDEMYNRKVISPTQAIKVLKDSPNRIAKVEEVITRPDGKPTVVPETDKRPAISIADDFTDLTQEDN